MSRRRRRWRASEDPLVQWGCLVPATLLLVGWVMFTIGLITYLFGGDFWTVCLLVFGGIAGLFYALYKRYG